jgi:hypothetical protein
MERDNTIQNQDMHVTGVPEEHLPAFYRGLSLLLTTQLDRTRTECIRVSRLKSLTDTDALMASYDEKERLRLACIKVFLACIKVFACIKASREREDCAEYIYNILHAHYISYLGLKKKNRYLGFQRRRRSC